jgi:hypothetical protein
LVAETNFDISCLNKDATAPLGVGIQKTHDKEPKAKAKVQKVARRESDGIDNIIGSPLNKRGLKIEQVKRERSAPPKKPSPPSRDRSKMLILKSAPVPVQASPQRKMRKRPIKQPRLNARDVRRNAFQPLADDIFDLPDGEILEEDEFFSWDQIPDAQSDEHSDDESDSDSTSGSEEDSDSSDSEPEQEEVLPNVPIVSQEASSTSDFIVNDPIWIVAHPYSYDEPPHDVLILHDLETPLLLDESVLDDDEIFGFKAPYYKQSIERFCYNHDHPIVICASPHDPIKLGFDPPKYAVLCPVGDFEKRVPEKARPYAQRCRERLLDVDCEEFRSITAAMSAAQGVIRTRVKIAEREVLRPIARHQRLLEYYGSHPVIGNLLPIHLPSTDFEIGKKLKKQSLVDLVTLLTCKYCYHPELESLMRSLYGLCNFYHSAATTAFCIDNFDAWKDFEAKLDVALTFYGMYEPDANKFKDFVAQMTLNEEFIDYLGVQGFRGDRLSEFTERDRLEHMNYARLSKPTLWGIVEQWVTELISTELPRIRELVTRFLIDTPVEIAAKIKIRIGIIDDAISREAEGVYLGITATLRKHKRNLREEMRRFNMGAPMSEEPKPKPKRRFAWARRFFSGLHLKSRFAWFQASFLQAFMFMATPFSNLFIKLAFHITWPTLAARLGGPADNIRDILWSLISLGVFGILDWVTLLWHGIDCFRSGAARFSFCVHTVVRLISTFGGDTLLSKAMDHFRNRNSGDPDHLAAQQDDDGFDASAFFNWFLPHGTDDVVRDLNSRIQLVRGIRDIITIISRLFEFVKPPHPATLRFRALMLALERRLPTLTPEQQVFFTQHDWDEIAALMSDVELMIALMSGKNAPAAEVNFPQFRDYYTRFKEFIDANKTSLKKVYRRVEPATVLFVGPAGTGKSVMARYWLKQAIRTTKGLDGATEQALDKLVYSFTSNANERMDGVGPHHQAVIMDDIFQKTTMQDRSSEAFLWCRLASQDDYYPEQAALAQKRTPINPRFIAGTSNLTDFRNIGLTDPTAFVRRANFLVHASKPIVTPGTDTGIDASKFGTVDVLQWNPSTGTHNMILHNATFEEFCHFSLKDESTEIVSRVHEDFEYYARQSTTGLPPVPEEYWQIKRLTYPLNKPSMVAPWMEGYAPRIIAAISGIAIIGFLIWLYKKSTSQRESHVIGQANLYDGLKSLKRGKKPMTKDQAKGIVHDQLYGQVAIDKQANDAINAMIGNFCFVEITKDGLTRSQHCLGVSGRCFILNKHTILGLGPNDVIRLWRLNAWASFPFSSMRFESIGDDSIVCYTPHLGSDFRSITTHFPLLNERPSNSYSSTDAVFLVGLKIDNARHVIFEKQVLSGYTFQCTKTPLNLKGLKTDIVLDGYFRYQGDFAPGDCVKVGISGNKHDRSRIKFLHGAAFASGNGVGSPVYRETLLEALDRLKIDNLIHREGPPEAQMGLHLKESLSDEELTAIFVANPIGRAFVGLDANHVWNEGSTKIHPSVMQKTHKTKEVVAHRRTWFDGDEMVVPMYDFVSSGVDREYLDPSLVTVAGAFEELRLPLPDPKLDNHDVATVDFGASLKAPKSSIFRSVMPIEMALNGMDGTASTALRDETAAGIKFERLCKGGGKHPFVQQEFWELPNGNLRKRLFLGKEGRRAVARLFENLRGRPDPSVMKDTQKDERYPKAKERKFRIVSTDDVAHLVLFRVLFGKFLDAARRTHPFDKSQVGIDAGGPEFNQMFHSLAHFSEDAIELDGRKWDLALHVSVFMEAARISIRWYEVHYPDEPKWLNDLRWNLIVPYCECFHLIGSIAYQSLLGMPSGFPATAEFNGMCGRLYLRVAYYLITGSLEDFDSHVRSVHYGDDLLATVFNKPSFNQMSFAQVAFQHLGMTFTTADKALPDQPYKPLRECSFISRSFVEVQKDFFMGALSKDVIEEIPMWVRTSDARVGLGMFRDNCCTALREAVPYGPEYFNQLRKTYNLILSNEGVREPITLNYGELLFEFIEKY